MVQENNGKLGSVIEPASQGRIVQMTVENFKSYRGTQVIGPFFGFTAIIGPNGSGKSNLMDAVSFVLGVRTAQLRGNLRDLLYNNSDLGPDFERPRRGAVKVLFEAGSGETVEFSRHIVPSGTEGFSSQYKINGETVSWEAYNEKLKGFGILVKARNFLVFQGDIESVAAMQPADLTNLVEQIAGTDALREEYERLELVKQSAEERTSHMFSKRKAIGQEKRQMKEQRDEAERHIEMEQELAAKKQEHCLWKLYHHEKDEESARVELTALNTELEAKSGAASQAESRLKEKRRAQATLTKQRVQLEKKLSKMRAARDDKKPELVRIRGELDRVTRRLQKGRRDLEACEKERGRHQGSIAKLTKDRDAVAAALEQHQAVSVAGRGISLTPEQREEYSRLEGKAGAASFKQTQERDDLRAAQKADEAELESLQKHSSQWARAREAEAAPRKGAGQPRREAPGEAAALGGGRSSQVERDALDKRLQAVEAKLREARADRRENERERKMKEAVANMKSIFSGVHGRMSELAEITNRKYNMAISVLLGRHMDSVVVDADKTARDCIQYLKEHRITSMTFIPLQNLKVSPINERLRQLGGSVKLAIDVVKYDPHVELAFVHVLENSVVCDTLDEARQLGYYSGERLKVCACDGTLINRNGNITGGGSSSMENRASRFDQKAIDELKSERDTIQAEMKELPDSRELRNQEQALSAEITGLEQRTKIKDSEIQRLSAKITKLEEDVKRLTASEHQYAPRIQTLKKETSTRAVKIDKLGEQINAIHNKFFSDFSARLGVPNIHEHMEAYDKQVAEFKKTETTLKSQLSKVKSHLDLVLKQSSDAERKSQKIKETLAADENAVKDLEADEERIRQESQSMEDSLQKEQQGIKALQDQIDSAEEELSLLQKETADATSEANKIRRSISSKQAQIEQLQSSRRDIIEAASIEQISLPRASQAGETANPEGAMVEDVETVGQGSARFDYSILKRSHTGNMTQEQRAVMNDEMKAAIDDLSAKLESHNPNMRALEQYDQIKEKERLQLEELEAAKVEAKTAADNFNNLRARRHQLFTTAFEHISNSIDPIYKELTKSRAHQLGGTAYLSLENPDEPFLHGIKYTAMPPSKRFRDMDQLSGGEKTIAALSLLFAINSFKPSPFFVLDECDAALDSTNVARIAAFVRARSRKEAKNSCQSIVISLKDIFYEQADSLVGVTKNLCQGSSTTFTLDLNRFDEARAH
eukprot:CAMPEP_0177607594 /NCGR_PEP_ID=MMETSP0419_2-20121207/18007_1 /TAXON_ID=582737 /ORGANISM="Tetraselmis sp., Strain GSL018" /LENGTH=1227 /DNA_ID=CAMNT_0019102199 /DNA_START=146 /DNA_END=3830 /DNA_ORIENTATION=+